MPLCERCGEDKPESEGFWIPPEFRGGGPEEWRCDNCNEAAYERMVEDYYGGDTPQTVEERYQMAYRQKRALR